MAGTYHLHRWAVTMMGDTYTAPEARTYCLTGFRDEETKAIVTSTIVSVQGREVTTYSGSVYILEDISPDYLKWLDENGFEVSADSPICFTRKK